MGPKRGLTSSWSDRAGSQPRTLFILCHSQHSSKNQWYSVSFPGSFFLNALLNTDVPQSPTFCILLFSYCTLSLDFTYSHGFRGNIHTIHCHIDISRYDLSPKHHTHIPNSWHLRHLELTYPKPTV